MVVAHQQDNQIRSDSGGAARFRSRQRAGRRRIASTGPPHAAEDEDAEREELAPDGRRAQRLIGQRLIGRRPSDRD